MVNEDVSCLNTSYGLSGNRITIPLPATSSTVPRASPPELLLLLFPPLPPSSSVRHHALSTKNNKTHSSTVAFSGIFFLAPVLLFGRSSWSSSHSSVCSTCRIGLATVLLIARMPPAAMGRDRLLVAEERVGKRRRVKRGSMAWGCLGKWVDVERKGGDRKEDRKASSPRVPFNHQYHFPAHLYSLSDMRTRSILSLLSIFSLAVASPQQQQQKPLAAQPPASEQLHSLADLLTTERRASIFYDYARDNVDIVCSFLYLCLSGCVSRPRKQTLTLTLLVILPLAASRCVDHSALIHHLPIIYPCTRQLGHHRSS
jgi:hypothetical protein